MSSNINFLDYLQQLGIDLAIDNDELVCTAPKNILNPELIENIARQKPHLIEHLKSKHSTIEIVPRTNKAYPLSYPQERLWFLNKTSNTAHTYNVQIALELKGELNITALNNAFNQIYARHEILRTIFPVIQGSAAQVITPYKPFHIELERKLTDAVKFIQQEYTKEFILETSCAMRAKIMRLDQSTHILSICLHHIICDYRSIQIILNELSLLYNSFCAANYATAPQNNLQYLDFAIWQRESFKKMPKSLAAAEYWQQALADARTDIMPLDCPRSADNENNISRKTHHFDKSISARIDDYTKAKKTTPTIFLLSVIYVLISKRSQQKDIIIGGSFSGRQIPALNNIVGYFANTLPLRFDIKNHEIAFSELLKLIGAVYFSTYEHSHIPLHYVLQNLRKENNDIDYGKLIQVMFEYHPQLPQPSFANLTTKLLKSGAGSARFDISFEFIVIDEVLSCEVTFNNSLFTEHTIHQHIENLNTCVLNVLQTPDTPLHSIFNTAKPTNIMPLDSYLIGKQIPLKQTSIREAFESSVRLMPHNIAAIFQSSKLSYSELNSKANQLAHKIRGIFADKKYALNDSCPIGVLLEPSLNTIIAILGIIKAGGCYVPLDTTTPAKYLKHYLTGINLVITTNKITANKNQLDDFKIEHLNIDDPDLLMQPTTNPSPLAPHNELVYVIYTSGSTGKPKGVAIKQISVLNYVQWFSKKFNVTSQDVFDLSFSISFDFSITSLFVPLLNGGSIAICSPRKLKSPELVVTHLIKNQVTFYKCTPSYFATLTMLTVDKERLQHLRYIILGGEKIRLADVKNWLNKHETHQIVNEFGPTETTVAVCAHIINTANAEHYKTDIPIGTMPIDNSAFYILDSNNKICPINTAGELFVAGYPVAQGYFYQPELTKNYFIKKPIGVAKFSASQPTHQKIDHQRKHTSSFLPCFSDDDSSVLYKTGDVCKIDQKGEICYLGRNDDQVKIRGYRIQLNELEASLRNLELIADCAVIKDPDDSTDHITAFIKAAISSISIAEITTTIAENFPSYMMPSKIILVDKIPLTGNGKTDKTALLISQRGRQATNVSPAETLTDTQSVLCKIWGEILSMNGVGIHQNYFTIGGHSINAIKVAFEVSKKFSINCSSDMVFKYPTIADQANFIDAMTQPPVIKKSLSPKHNSVISHNQKRMLFLEMLNSEKYGAYNTHMTIKLTGHLNHNILESCLNTIIKRHEILRTFFRYLNGDFVAHVENDFSLFLANTSFNSSETIADEIYKKIRAEITQPFDLFKSPPIRAFLFIAQPDNKPGIAYFTVCCHHILMDAWSATIIFDELVQLYTAKVNNLPIKLPTLEYQYQDFSIKEHEQDFTAQKLFWSNHLNNYIPINFAVPPQKTIATDSTSTEHYFTIKDEVFIKLDHFVTTNNLTKFQFMFACLQLLIRSYTLTNDLVIGTPIANRDDESMKQVVGMLTNTLPIRMNLSHDISVSDFFQSAKNTFLSCYGHKQMPYDLIIQSTTQAAPQGKRTPPSFENHGVTQLSTKPAKLFSSASDLIQVFFNYIHNQPITATLPELEYEFIHDIDTGFAKFNLTLNVLENSDNLQLIFNYKSTLFTRSTIASMANRLLSIIHAAIDNPQACVEKMLINSNDQLTIPLLFYNQVGKSSDKIAIYEQGIAYTYHALNAFSNQIGHYLKSLNVGACEYIGVCMPRSYHYIASIIAIMKIGASFIPLDPNAPTERQKHILKSCRLKIILVNADSAKNWGWFSGHTINVGQNAGIKNQQPDSNIYHMNTVADLAYVIFTSGSTGIPKGVIGKHRGLINRLHWQWQRYPYDLTDKAICRVPNYFVDSIAEIFSPLLCGIPNFIFPDENNKDIEKLAAWITSNKISHLVIIPTLLNVFLDYISITKQTLKSLKFCFVSGEVLLPCLVEKFRQILPNVKLINLYGSTEVAADVTYFDIENWQSGAIPIGKPLPNTQVFILDNMLRPVQVGKIGEIHVAGICLAAGYINQPQLTRKQFITAKLSIDNSLEPLSERALYKTGDLGSMNADGDIFFHGRVDQQVKINGIRIELTEIDNAIQKFSAIKQAKVVANTLATTRQLVCHYELKENFSNFTVQSLKEFLRQHLPAHMIPSRFIKCNALPLTATGKLAIKNLSAPLNLLDQHSATENGSLRNTLSSIFCDLLQSTDINAEDALKDILRNSILVMQLIIALTKKLGVSLTFSEIFQCTSTEKLIVAIGDKRQSTTENFSAPQLLKNNSANLALQQESFYHLSRINSQTPYNVHRAWNIKGEFNIQCFTNALKELCNRHAMLRATFNCELTQPKQNLIEINDLPIKHINLSARPNSLHTSREIIETEIATPFILNQGLLFRFIIITLSAECTVMCFIAHYLICDNFSLDILANDLSNLYSSIIDKNFPCRLPDIQLEYFDYVSRQRQFMSSKIFGNKLANWCNYLANLPEPLFVSIKNRLTHTADPSNATHRFVISKASLCKLTSFTQKHDCSLFTVLLAALALLLAEENKRSNIIIGTVFNNRCQFGTDNLIGQFVSVLPIRIDLTRIEHSSPNALLNTIKQNVIFALEHQEIPFSCIVNKLNHQSSLVPLFQVMLNFFDNSTSLLRFPNAHVESFDINSTTDSILDLSLTLTKENSHIKGQFVYNTEKFNHAHIMQLENKYLDCLSTLINSTELKLPLMNSEDRVATSTKMSMAEPYQKDNYYFSMIKNIWLKLLNLDSIGADEDFFAVGGHSILAMQMLLEIENIFSKKIPMAFFFDNPTIAATAAWLQTNNTNLKNILLPINEVGSRQPIFCIRPGGGLTVCYHKLANALGKEQPIYILQALNDSNNYTIDDLAETYIDAIRSIKPSGPYILLGYSFGAIVAFEMACKLGSSNIEQLIIVDARVTDELRTANSQIDIAATLLEFFNDWAIYSGKQLYFDAVSFGKLDWDNQIKFLFNNFKSVWTEYSVMSFNTFRQFITTLAYDLRALYMHHIDNKSIACKTTIVRAADSFDEQTDSSALGWEPYLKVQPHCITVPGSHYTVFDQPDLRAFTRLFM